MQARTTRESEETTKRSASEGRRSCCRERASSVPRMNRIRPETSARPHACIGSAAAECLVKAFSPSLQRYLLAYGVNHLIAGDERRRAEAFVRTWSASFREKVSIEAIYGLAP